MLFILLLKVQDQEVFAISLDWDSVQTKSKSFVLRFHRSVSIKVNGKAIELPATPVRSTNANGITDVIL